MMETLNKHKEAIKLAAKKIKKEQYMLFNFGYELKMVVPYAQGVIMIAAMENAEQLTDPYSGSVNVMPLDGSKFTVTLMDEFTYTAYKLAGILNLTLAEAKELQKVTQ